ncbi:predicted protein [Thalassiosira pseudonana CCMP1335]|uniref:Condensation domain-containing protein n=1 Tax=Thalassiosira pseudonana TaxID=35128 RepID=B8C3R0_THAPS|nr:predicted protein [Thalassiosira pseudonana CCMP1335]EED92604.1 predicted protein [Thalassiosira pseudonana CCMP1335]
MKKHRQTSQSAAILFALCTVLASVSAFQQVGETNIMRHTSVEDASFDCAAHQTKFQPQSKEQEQAILTSTKPTFQERRPLGAMELFMLPRPVGPEQDQNDQRPPMNHIAAFILSSTPSTWALQQALDSAVRTHPLLRSRVVGNGQPKKWLDPIRRMVRWNGGWDEKEEDPLEFISNAISESNVVMETEPNSIDDSSDKVSCPKYWGGALHIVNVNGTSREELDRSWQHRFQEDLDSSTVVSVAIDGSHALANTRDLWKLEMHRLSSNVVDDKDTQCALVLTLNHAISDQGSVDLVMDEIISDIEALEAMDEKSKKSYTTKRDPLEIPAVIQPLPTSLCDSLLGDSPQNEDCVDKSTDRQSVASILRAPFAPSLKKLREYACHRIQASILHRPALLPRQNEGGIIESLSILLFGRPLSGFEDITTRRSNVHYRTIPSDVTAALVKQSKKHRVPISMTLAAAVATTCSDYFNADENHREQRVYKVLQSLDTRRFAGASDVGNTLSCQAGGMDLYLGPMQDCLGRDIREYFKCSTGIKNPVEAFWTLAKQSFDQTSSFLKSGQAIESVRLFALGMSICDIGRLVETYTRSRATQGRAWSAGITNVGEYERQRAVVREGMQEQGQLKATHGEYTVEEIYFATSHARVGCTFPVGCITVAGSMCCTINPPWPLVSDEKSKAFADDFVELLEIIARSDN